MRAVIDDAADVIGPDHAIEPADIGSTRTSVNTAEKLNTAWGLRLRCIAEQTHFRCPEAVFEGFNGAIVLRRSGRTTDTQLAAKTVALGARTYGANTGSAAEPAGIHWRQDRSFSCSTMASMSSTGRNTCGRKLVGRHPKTPLARVLTTSRVALRVEGEHLRDHLLYALDCPPDEEDLTTIESLKYAATLRFSWAGAARGYDAALNDVDAPIAATLCRPLDGA